MVTESQAAPSHDSQEQVPGTRSYPSLRCPRRVSRVTRYASHPRLVQPTGGGRVPGVRTGTLTVVGVVVVHRVVGGGLVVVDVPVGSRPMGRHGIRKGPVPRERREGLPHGYEGRAPHLGALTRGRRTP